MRYLLAKHTAILSQKIIHLFKLGKGETAPGLVSIKIDPNFVKHAHTNIRQRIIISGTNGKTTTTFLVANILRDAQIPYNTNPSGSNLLRGVATSALTITPNTHTVLWETDEAALIPIAQQVQPTLIMLTNLFRDQLDRYGEIDTILNKWLQLLQKLPSCTLILNADDPSLVFLGSQLPQHKIIYYGIKRPKQSQLQHGADAIFCPLCGKRLHFVAVSYSHLGNYRCCCGFKRPQLDIALQKYSYSQNRYLFSVNDQKYTLNLDGVYNLYNSLAAISLATELKINPAVLRKTVKQFQPAFGRQEKLTFKKHSLQMFLVKNPTGFNQVIDTLKNKTSLPVMIAINDQIADGTDVSWLWDVDFEHLFCEHFPIIVTGQRAYDMGLRLKYSGFLHSQFKVIPDFQAALDTMDKLFNSDFYILPTYTAMWQLREIINS